MNLVLALGTQIVLARALLPEARGLFALALLLPTLLNVVFQFGQDSANAVYAGTHKDRRQHLFMQSVIMALIGGAASVLAIMAFYWWLPINRGEFSSLSTTIIVLICIYAPMTIAANLMLSLVRGIGRTPTAAVFSTIEFFVTLVLCAVVLLLLDGKVAAAVAISLAAVTLRLAMCTVLLRKYISFRPSLFSWEIFKKSLRFGGTICLANVAIYLTYRIDQGLLAYMVTKGQLGLYAVAVGVAERIKVLPASITTALLPSLSNDLENRSKQVPMVFRLSFIASVATMLVMSVVGTLFIVLFFGREYYGSIWPFLVLLPGVAALVGDGVLSCALAAMGKPKYAMWVSWGALTVNVLLNVALIPQWGILGAAFASTVAYVFDAVFLTMCFLRFTNLPWTSLAPTTGDVALLWRTGMDVIRKVKSVGSRPAPAKDTVNEREINV